MSRHQDDQRLLQALETYGECFDGSYLKLVGIARRANLVDFRLTMFGDGPHAYWRLKRYLEA